MVIHEGETLAEIRERIQKKLQVADEEFAKVMFKLPYYNFLNLVKERHSHISILNLEFGQIEAFTYQY